LFKVYLPYGTAVRARIDNEPYMGPEGGKVLDISVLPSVHDQEGSSRGLCGTLNNDTHDDFHARTILNDIKPLTDENEFIKYWKVPENESLFTDNVYRMVLDNWAFPTCSCRDDQTSNGPTCSRSTSSCTPGTVTGEHSCAEETNRRSVRSVQRRPRVPRIKLIALPSAGRTRVRNLKFYCIPYAVV